MSAENIKRQTKGTFWWYGPNRVDKKLQFNIKICNCNSLFYIAPNS